MTEPKERYSNAFTATLAGITDLFKKQKDPVVIGPEDNVKGKTILITGASSGLGFEAAMQLAQRGGHILMACRSGIPEKGEQVRQQSGSQQVDMFPVDLADLDSVVKLVEAIQAKGVKIDILIDNAAVVSGGSRKTPQGLEEMFVVNYLSKFLLVRLLLERQLFNTGGKDVPRIIYVSSESHRNPKAFDWDHFGEYKDYSMGKTVALYGYYKLLMTTMANTLSRKLNEGGKLNYSVFALCPGPVNSNIARESPAIFKPLLKVIFGIFFRSPKQAVQPVVYFATSPEVKDKAMDYLFLMSRKEMDDKATDVANGERLWVLSERVLREKGY